MIYEALNVAFLGNFLCDKMLIKYRRIGIITKGDHMLRGCPSCRCICYEEIVFIRASTWNGYLLLSQIHSILSALFNIASIPCIFDVIFQFSRLIVLPCTLIDMLWHVYLPASCLFRFSRVINLYCKICILWTSRRMRSQKRPFCNYLFLLWI